MGDEELAEHIRNVRKLRGDAFVSGRHGKAAKSMTSGGKGAKEITDLCNQLGVDPDTLVELLAGVMDEG
jgi:hypothetical protein